jgi:uncharacterized short protein YbdD (DUF466 family)
MSWGSSGGSTSVASSGGGWGTPQPQRADSWANSPASRTQAPKPAGWGNSSPASSPASARPASQAAPSSWGASSSGSTNPANTWGTGNSKPADNTSSSWATSFENSSATSGWGTPSSSSGWGSTSSWGSSGGWGNSSASSWANSQAKNPEEHGRTANQAQGSIAQEIYQAGAQAYEAYVDHMRENEDVTVTTERMRRLCQETDDIANHSIQGLKEQNEKLEHLQDEMAEIHDDLNTSEKKMKQIKSFWGGFATMGSSRTHDQHQKMRVKDEKARDKMNERQAYELGKMEHQADKAAASANKAAISQHVHDNKKAIHQAKKENMAEAKAINKGRAEATEEKQVWGGHVFEMRVDGGGPKCQAEKDLDVISDYIHGFHEKAELMDTLAGDSTRRAQNVNSEVERATARTKALNKQADRYCGKK